MPQKEILREDTTLLRKLTLKSRLGFGKYANETIERLILLRQQEYLKWIYYNNSNIDFMPDTLDAIGIKPEDRIKKPGKDASRYEKTPVIPEPAQQTNPSQKSDFDAKYQQFGKYRYKLTLLSPKAQKIFERAATTDEFGNKIIIGAKKNFPAIEELIQKYELSVETSPTLNENHLFMNMKKKLALSEIMTLGEDKKEQTYEMHYYLNDLRPRIARCTNIKAFDQVIDQIRPWRVEIYKVKPDDPMESEGMLNDLVKWYDTTGRSPWKNDPDARSKKMIPKFIGEFGMNETLNPNLFMKNNGLVPDNNINEKAESEVQQMAAGMAYAAKKGEMPAEELKGAAKEMYDSMTLDQLHDFAATKHDNIPHRIEPVDEDQQPLANQQGETYFNWKDKTGRGFTANKITKSHMLATWGEELEEEDWNGKTLREFLDDAYIGDVWENRTTRLECTHIIEPQKIHYGKNDLDENKNQTQSNVMETKKVLNEPAASPEQQALFGIARGMQKGEVPKNYSKTAAKIAKDVEPGEVKKFASSTKEEGVNEETFPEKTNTLPITTMEHKKLTLSNFVIKEEDEIKPTDDDATEQAKLLHKTNTTDTLGECSKNKKYRVTETQMKLVREIKQIREDMSQLGADIPPAGDQKWGTAKNNLEEISRQSHPEAVEQMNSYLGSGRPASITFVKMSDNSLRIADGKIIPKAAKEAIQGIGHIDREKTNTYLYWDNNAQNKKDPEKYGDYRSFNLDTIMIFKGGDLLLDFTQANTGAYARLTPDDKQKLMAKLNKFKEVAMKEPVVV